MDLFPTEEVDLTAKNPSEVIHAVARGGADVGLVPFFNVYAGSHGVPSYYRDLLTSGVTVLEVIPYGVHVCLVAPKGTHKRKLKRVLFMPVLAAQCSNYLVQLKQEQPNIDVQPRASITTTPQAIVEARTMGRGAAALVSERAAEDAEAEGDFVVLKRNVQNEKPWPNVTFFLLLARVQPPVRELVCAAVRSAEIPPGKTAARLLADRLARRGYTPLSTWREPEQTVDGGKVQFLTAWADSPLDATDALDDGDVRAAGRFRSAMLDSAVAGLSAV